MRINEYQGAALRTESRPFKGRDDEDLARLLQGLIGLCGEAGECIDIYKKHVFQGHELDKAQLAKELGDVAWYLAVSAAAIGYDLESIMRMNIDKLRRRYPEGFDSELSQHREPGDE